MNRELKRVALDFNWPLNQIWKGYTPALAQGIAVNSCPACQKKYTECSENASYCIYHPENYTQWHYEPPQGKGYQLWETVSEGSPITPVFDTLDQLCRYAAKNVSFFGKIKISKEEWKEALTDNPGKNILCYHQGNIVSV